MTIRVLIADDHAMLRDGLRALLATAPDIRIAGEAGNGRDAVSLTRELAPDVVLMDIAMPELNGIEAARLMRERQPSSRIIMLSMHSSIEHVHRALSAGVSGFLLKESAGQEVITAVRTVAAGQRYLGESIERMLQNHPHRNASPVDRLSVREIEVLQLVVEGRSSAEIAAIVHLSPKTVETYRSRLMKKLGVADVPALVKFALQHGLTPPT